MNKKLKIILISVLALVVALCAAACAGGSTEKYTLKVLESEYLLHVGSNAKIQAEYDGKEQINFTSLDDTVATVDTNGKITAVGEGVTYVSVSVPELKPINCKVIVRNTVCDLSIGYEALTLVKGSIKVFTATYYEDGVEKDEPINWSVSNGENCSFSSNGKKATFTATKTGDFIITAQTARTTKTCTIKVISETAQRLETPQISVYKCNTVMWNAVDGAKGYAISVGGSGYATVSAQTNSYDITQNVANLKVNESIVISLKALATEDYDKIDSYINLYTFEHNYNGEESVDATCVDAGVMDYTCEDCGNQYSDTQYYEPHVWNEGVCEKCEGYRTPGLFYFYDGNYITFPTQTQAAFAITDENMQDPAWVAEHKNEWKVKYYTYWKAGMNDIYLDDKDKLSDDYDEAKADHDKKQEKVEESDRVEFTPKEKWLADKKKAWLTDAAYLYRAVNYRKDGIPEADREKCYYVAGLADANETIVHVAGTYDDGKHGRLPVRYVGPSAFERNQKITHVIFPDSVEKIGGGAFIHTANLKHVQMRGVTQIVSGQTGSNSFLSTIDLEVLIINKNFYSNVQTFISNVNNFKGGKMVIYAMEEGGSIRLADRDRSADVGLWTKEIYYYEETGTLCNTWRFAEDGYTVIRNTNQHNFVNGKCVHCPTKDDYGIKYIYDKANDCYYVADNTGFTGNVATVQETYNDGRHGDKPVAYMVGGAFMRNKNINHVVLPKTLTTIGDSAFFRCDNLKTVVMPGVTALTNSNEFHHCVGLEALIVGKNFTTNSNQHFAYYAGEVEEFSKFVVCALEKGGEISIKGIRPLYSGKIYYYSQGASACGSWGYAADGYNVIFNDTHQYSNGVCTSCGSYQTAGLTYTYNSTLGGYVVTDYTGTSLEVYVAGEYDDGTNGKKAVVAIGEGAFQTASGAGEPHEITRRITKVVLPESVKYLGRVAFRNCYTLETLIMPGVVASISQPWVLASNCTFENCQALKSIVVCSKIDIRSNNFNGTFVDGATNLIDVYIVDGNAYTNINLTDGTNKKSLGQVYGQGQWKYDANGNPTPVSAN